MTVTVDRDTFRSALAQHASGVVIVTALSENVPVGLTATSFSSASLAPPLVQFSIDRDSTTWPWLRLADHFAVNVLAGDQAGLATRFARRGIDRFGGPTRWRPGRFGAPLLAGAAAHLVCRPHANHDIGDHVLVVGEVIEAEIHPARPLLYHRGRFGHFRENPL
ncbi:flavin reductase family protein [Nonomuraea sp. NPDC050310]|uniref:flavin reductase family protein n=1 Tax=unclassified Nonomuraea TaxID=2593643 RepID=UPI0033E02E4B